MRKRDHDPVLDMERNVIGVVVIDCCVLKPYLKTLRLNSDQVVVAAQPLRNRNAEAEGEQLVHLAGKGSVKPDGSTQAASVLVNGFWISHGFFFWVRRGRAQRGNIATRASLWLVR